MSFQIEISLRGDTSFSQIPSAIGFSIVVVIILEMIARHSPTRNKCSNMQKRLPAVPSRTQQRSRSQHDTAQNLE
jgi:hypothetical protein